MVNDSKEPLAELNQSITRTFGGCAEKMRQKSIGKPEIVKTYQLIPIQTTLKSTSWSLNQLKPISTTI